MKPKFKKGDAVYLKNLNWVKDCGPKEGYNLNEIYYFIEYVDNFSDRAIISKEKNDPYNGCYVWHSSLELFPFEQDLKDLLSGTWRH